MGQLTYSGFDSYKKLPEILHGAGVKKALLVCGGSFRHLNIRDFIESMDMETIKFSDFGPNPLYEDVCKGVELFNREGCDAVLAVGGGSAIDVGKCIKLYCRMDHTKNYLEQDCFDSGIPLIALPTTAGTGSESTRFAVIYYKEEKQSIKHESILPDYVVLEPSVLKNLPVYQKKCTMLDALCQGIESWWSVNSTGESRRFSQTAVQMIAGSYKAYLNDNSDSAAETIMLAANYAGRAINITQTTAAHAMSYKLTSLYGLPHGHAVAVCLPEVWEYMTSHSEACIDERGAEHLKKVFSEIAETLDCEDTESAIRWFRELLDELEIGRPLSGDREKELNLLAASVNPVRLKNNPVALSGDILRKMYERIVRS